MKKYLLVTILILSAATTIYLTGKNPDKNEDNKPDLNKTEKVSSKSVNRYEVDDCCREIKSETYTDESIYNFDGKWIDQDNKQIILGQFKSKNVILAMFFASCRSACPVLVNNMKIIESLIPKDKIGEYRFVLVSIDPERDTPNVLAAYAKERNLDTERWSLLTGSKNDVMELSMLLGFKFSKNESGGFSHTNLISFLNRDGEITYQNEGLSVEKNSISNALASLNK